MSGFGVLNPAPGKSPSAKWMEDQQSEFSKAIELEPKDRQTRKARRLQLPMPRAIPTCATRYSLRRRSFSVRWLDASTAVPSSWGCSGLGTVLMLAGLINAVVMACPGEPIALGSPCGNAPDPSGRAQHAPKRQGMAQTVWRAGRRQQSARHGVRSGRQDTRKYKSTLSAGRCRAICSASRRPFISGMMTSVTSRSMGLA